VAISKLEFVPDKVDEVDFLGDRLGWPGPPTGAGDQLEAGVDAAHVIRQVGAGDRACLEVLEVQPRRCCKSLGDNELLDE
jgi:hypothetical protein